MKNPYSVQQGRGGAVVQSGVPSGEARPAWAGQPMGLLCEAVVTAVYYPEEDTRAVVKGTQKAVTCDVRLLRSGQPVYRVPVLQWHQLHDQDIKIPRPAALNTAGGKLAPFQKGSTGAAPTVADKMDGDRVIVGFLESSWNRPVILPFCQPHGDTRQKIVKSAGRVRRIRHSGSMLEIKSGGDIALDATGAAKESLSATGAEQSNSGTGGKITIQTQDSSKAASSIVLDTSGGIKLLDAAGDYVELTKSSKQIKAVAGLALDVTAPTVKFKATSAFQVNSGPATITSTGAVSATGTSISATATGAISLTAAAQATIAASSITGNAGSIILGLTAPLPLIKHTPWATVWGDLNSEATNQIKQYLGPPPMQQVAVADYIKLLQKVLAVAGAFPSLTTVITKAG